MWQMQIPPVDKQFTRDNAREMQKRSAAAQRAKRAAIAAELAALRAAPVVADHELRRLRVEQQLDEMLLVLADANDANEKCKITNAIDKLWNLLYPRAGVLKTKGGSRGIARPMPAAAQPVAVAPDMQHDETK